MVEHVVHNKVTAQTNSHMERRTERRLLNESETIYLSDIYGW